MIADVTHPVYLDIQGKMQHEVKSYIKSKVIGTMSKVLNVKLTRKRKQRK